MSSEKNNSNVSHTKHRHLRLGLFGFGCVGQGLYHVLDETPGIKAEIKEDLRQTQEQTQTIV